MGNKLNVNLQVISDFGNEWTKFNQSILKMEEVVKAFDGYFKIFPWERLGNNVQGFDLGCGSGRWAQLVAPKVKKLYCIDPSEKALDVAKFNLKNFKNIEFINASVEYIPLQDNSMDFGYSLGVLHHISDTQKGIQACVEKLKVGAPLLLYLYYAFDNKPKWFKIIWQVSDWLRKIIARLPFKIKYLITQFIAVVIYYPVARTALLLEVVGIEIDNFPLSAYRNQRLYVMRTDALDRFGTRLEKRFTAEEIKVMMEMAGLVNVEIGDTHPYWCAIGYKK